jgi:dipeptidyl-peptidase-3
MVYGNRMNLNSRPGRPCYYVHASESKDFMHAAHVCRIISTATHELIGHGTGKFLAEIASGKYNFDHTNPPISPVTGEPVKTWYKPGETWVNVFGKLAPTVEECRAFLVADYLTDNKSILALFGYDEHSTPTADDSGYNSFLWLLYIADNDQSFTTLILKLESRVSAHFRASTPRNKLGEVIMIR